MAESPVGLSPEIVAQYPFVAMFTAPNGGPKTLSGTHTYVVGRGRAIIIDPGPAIPSYISSLLAWLQLHETEAAAIVLTHGHPDHAPGAAQLAALTGAPIWASPKLDRSYLSEPMATQHLEDGHVFAVDGDELRALATPGHSADHLCFFLSEARILFAGDTILGQGSTLVAPPEGNMRQYMDSLRLLAKLDATLIAPAHGPLIRDPAAKIEEYIGHREERELQIRTALSEGPATVFELVAWLYADVNPELHRLAAGSVETQLIKLQEEGYVERRGDEFRIRD